MRIFIALLVVVGLFQGLLAATVQVPSKTEKVEVPSKTEGVEVPSKTESVEVPSKTEGVEVPSKTEGVEVPLDVAGDPSTKTEDISIQTESETPKEDITKEAAESPKDVTTTKKNKSKPSKSKEDDQKPSEPTLTLAERCEESICQLPNCRCSDTKLGHDIPTKKIPQFVTITFDDAVTALNHKIFEGLFENVTNPDGCDASLTFFFSHDYTDYTKVHDLWAKGHELALHSITHGMGTMYWKKASVDVLTREFGQQLDMIEHFAQIDRADIKGMRMPHFEIPGNRSFVVAKNLGLLYDSSWPTQQFVDPALWPYTLDYKSMQDCPIGKCPDASFPGLWENPLVNWQDIEGYKCAMVDACIHLPEDDKEQLLNWMISNFNRHYLGNRAPFGAYLHSSWFQKGEHYLEAFKEFIQYMNQHSDVHFVSGSRVIEYMKNPVAGNKPFKGCPKKNKNICKPTRCQLRKVDTKDDRWMDICTPCPEVYPWLDNPMGNGA